MDTIFGPIVSILHGIKEWMPNLFNLFTHSEVAIGLALGMILLGLFIYLYLFMRFYLPTKLELERLIEKLKKVKDAKDMALNFSYVNSAMNKVEFAAHSWREFLKTLVFPEEGSNAPIRSTVSPSEFFNMETAEEGGITIKPYSHVADSFVGIGLVLTFLGLVSGIYFASKGLNGTVEEAKAGLVLLLGAATFKFMTSIAGVGIAVLFTIGYNKIHHNLEKAFIELSALLEARVLTANMETIAFVQHTELRKQTQILEQLLETMGDRVSRLEKDKH